MGDQKLTIDLVWPYLGELDHTAVCKGGFTIVADARLCVDFAISTNSTYPREFLPLNA